MMTLHKLYRAVCSRSMALHGTREDGPGLRWLRLKNYKYRDETGKEFVWEYVERTTRLTDIDAVEVLPIFTADDGTKQVLLVAQFRPAVGKISVEFPAGLIDESETPKAAANRELREEAGCAGECIAESPLLSREPSIVNETVQIFTYDVHKQDLEKELDAEEAAHDLHVFSAPLSSLSTTLENMSKEGMMIDGLVYTFALGIDISRRFKL